MAWFFAFFFVSGFCSLVYQVIWLRLAMAAFGVTTPFVSIVLSVFMAGLALGSWGVGRLGRRLERAAPRWPLQFYALVEIVIGLSALTVPYELAWGRSILAAGSGVAWDSATYYLASGVWVTLALLPFCVAMGATFPLAMAAIRREGLAGSERSFSYLYLANVLGATSGTLVSAFVLVEVFGFAATLLVTALVNVLLAGAAMYRSTVPQAVMPSTVAAVPSTARGFGVRPPAMTVVLLFLTGLTSMALEVVWIRQFTPYLGTMVYAFAAILGVYLIANFAGSGLYRRQASAGRIDRPARWFVLAWTTIGLLALVPLLTADPRLSLHAVARLVVGIVPFCVAVGFLTPMLVDWWSAGDPDRAGRAYAVNVIGCVLGPLLAGFWLLPAWGERGTLIGLSLPLFAVGLLAVMKPARFLAVSVPGRTWTVAVVFGVSVAAGVTMLFATRGFESLFSAGHVRRDHTATIIAVGSGRGKRLLVNGIGITKLSPMTKMMGHLPVLALDRPPRNALVVCLGMGTSFRSLLSWNIPVTAVELVPSVPQLLNFFHADVPALGTSPQARIVVDDGRRFLERSGEQYDVITIDPPPPIMAAGSSLLYSHEFYEVVKRRLRPDGVLQQWIPWLPGEDPVIIGSISRALRDSFPHVRVFGGLEGWGSHFLASMRPIDLPTPAVLAARMPAAAVADMLEWGPASTGQEQLRLTLSREINDAVVEAMAAGAPPLSDDRPYNEYFFLRRYLWWRMAP
jgi:spermidine synthase